MLRPTGVSCNEPFGSRPEPGASLIASTLLLSPGEAPKGRAGVDLQPTCPCARAHSGGPCGKRALHPCRTHRFNYPIAPFSDLPTV
jgi:hypothetical protein